MPGHDLEHLADEAVGRPRREPDAAARARDARQLGRGLLVVGREHGAEDRERGVEGRVRHRDVLGVALDQVDVEALGLGAAPAAVEQRGHVVDADDVAAVAGRGDRRVAAAAGDVEDAPAGLRVDGVEERVGDGLDQRAIAWKSPLAHIACWRCLIWLRSGAEGAVSVIVIVFLPSIWSMDRRYGGAARAASVRGTHLRPRPYLSLPAWVQSGANPHGQRRLPLRR